MKYFKILLAAFLLYALGSCSKILDNILPDLENEGKDEIGSIANSLKFSSEHVATAFIRQDGSLWIMGARDMTATGAKEDVKTPVQLGTDKDWIGVSVGAKAIFALKTNGTLWSWGVKEFVGRSGNNWIPSKVNEDTDWQYVHSGLYNTFAIKRDGSLWGCGQGNYNGSGLFGDGTLNDRPLISRIGKGSDWKMLSLFGTQIFAVKSNGSIWGWGFAQNKASRIMLYGSEDSQLSAVKIGKSENWVKVAPAGASVIGLQKDGTIWGWGTNEKEIVSPDSPVKLNDEKTWKDIAVNSHNGAALKNDGSAWIFYSSSIGYLPTGSVMSASEGSFISLEVEGALSGILAQRKGEDSYCWVSSHALYLNNMIGVDFFLENRTFKKCATLN